MVVADVLHDVMDGYRQDMTTTPGEPSPTPEVVPSGDPDPISTPSPEPGEDPGVAPAPEVDPDEVR